MKLIGVSNLLKRLWKEIVIGSRRKNRGDIPYVRKYD